MLKESEGVALDICSFIYFVDTSFYLQVLSRLSELEATLDAGIRHRNKALTSIGFHLTKWMIMVRCSYSFFPLFVFS